MSEKLSDIFDRFIQENNMDFFPKTSIEKINAFEKENDIKLPEKYKEWLLLADGCDLYLPAGVQLYGVVHKPVIDVAFNDRPSDDYVVIGALSEGDPVLFEKGSEKIAIYNHAAGQIEDDEIYPDFIAFLNDLDEILGLGE